jgi:hypothetical protein
MRECLCIELPFPQHFVFPPVTFFFIHLTSFWPLTFIYFYLVLLDMYSLHRTWGDDLIVRGHCSCFVSFGFLTFLFFSFFFVF